MNDLQTIFTQYKEREENFLNEQINTIKDIMKHTDFLKGSLLAYDESMVEASERRTDAARFMDYRQNRFPYAGLDCDATLWTNVMYVLLYGFELDIIPQIKNGCKYQIEFADGHYYRGDTLTSGWTILKKYLNMLWRKDSVSEQFKALFAENKETREIEPPEGEKEQKLERYVWKNIDVISEEMRTESKAFYQNIFNCGNYIAVPAGDWSASFNMQRSNYGLWDTVDRMLWKIYQYFISGKNEQYLKEMFVDKKEAVCKYVLQWFADFSVDSWDDFVEVHYFQDYVRENESDMGTKYGAPVSLKWSRMNGESNKVVYIDDILELESDYEPMPSGGEFENFFLSANYFLNRRTARIYEKIRTNK